MNEIILDYILLVCSIFILLKLIVKKVNEDYLLTNEEVKKINKIYSQKYYQNILKFAQNMKVEHEEINFNLQEDYKYSITKIISILLNKSIIKMYHNKEYDSYYESIRLTAAIKLIGQMLYNGSNNKIVIIKSLDLAYDIQKSYEKNVENRIEIDEEGNLLYCYWNGEPDFFMKMFDVIQNSKKVNWKVKYLEKDE